ncbi:MAG TPA: cation transporter, partial [Acidobacteriaceae bacterium]|nr:cation transporter [Acidobacteriaceae bacterium]
MPTGEKVEHVTETVAKAPRAAQTVTLPVMGMSCAACQSHVERALRGTPGVEEASVNLLTNSARVRFNPGVATLDNLITSVREAGYDAALPSEAVVAGEDRSSEEGALRAKAVFTLIGGVVVLALANAQRWLAPVAPVLFRVTMRDLEWTMLAITLPGMIWGGGIVYRQAWTAAIHRSTNMNTLVALGTGA